MTDPIDNVQRTIAKFSTSEIVRENLIRAALLITAYETLRDMIVSRPLGFFSREWTPKGSVPDENYRKHVGALHRSMFMASCLWFRQMEAIDDDDLRAIERSRDHRNDVVHELLKYLVDPAFEVNTQIIDDLGRLQTKIDRWWITQIEIPTNPDMDGVVVDEGSAQSGSTIVLNIIRTIALENEVAKGNLTHNSSAAPDEAAQPSR